MNIFFNEDTTNVMQEIKKPLEIWFSGDNGKLTSHGIELPSSINIYIWGERKAKGYKSTYHQTEAFKKNLPEQEITQLYFSILEGDMAGLPCCMLITGQSQVQYSSARLIAMTQSSMYDYIWNMKTIPFGNYNKFQLEFTFEKIKETPQVLEDIKSWLSYIKKNNIDITAPLPETANIVQKISPASELKQIKG